MRRVVIVGAGAAGVYAAYRLRQRFGAEIDITLLESSDRVGGNASTLAIGDLRIECGAQFFHRGAQPRFLALLGELDLFDDARVVRAAAGFTIWDRVAQRRLLHLPATVAGFGALGFGDWIRATKFGIFLAYAWALERWETDWTLSVDAWLGRMRLLDDDFKRRVIVPFLYQFVALPPARIGDASAKYAVTYLVRTLFPGADRSAAPGVPRIGRARPTFEALQSLVGIAEIHRRVLAAADVRAQTKTRVLELRPRGERGATVVTDAGEIAADEVVLATDPHASARMLESSWDSRLVDGLRALEYARLPISIQRGQPAHMPQRRSDWQPFNTIVDGDALMFSVWFGPMREAMRDGSPLPVFKSWGSPEPYPARAASEVHALEHFVPLPTTAFMRDRDELLPRFQGMRGLWFAGGWTRWFDSQEAALASAGAVADAMTQRETARAPELDARAQLEDVLHGVAAYAPASLRQSLIQTVDAVETRG